MNNLKQSLVSICIPVYNGASFIGKTIESVLNQSYRNIEIVILDNASTDRTKKIVAGYEDDRIRFILNPQNIGMCANWNKALVEAKGNYIKLLPADDLIYQDCIERQVEAFQKYSSENIALVCCGRDIIDSSGKVIISRRFFGANGVVPGKTGVKKIIRSGTNLLGEPGAILFRQDLLTKTGGFVDDFPYVIDLNLWVKILKYGNLYVIPESLCAFRVSPQSESVNTRHSHSHDFSGFIKSLDANYYNLTSFDVFVSEINCFILEILRRLFYKLSKVISIFYGKRK